MFSARLLLPFLLVFFAGCSWAPSLGVHKIDINQGNALTQDLVEKLKVGQSKAQVRAILGTPLLADIYHADRWDYVHEFRYQGKLVAHRGFSVFFADDKLTRWQGDEQPPSPAILNRQAQAASQAEQPAQTPAAAEEPGILTRFWNWLKS
ncbi:Outer membrane protein assembly factor BamE [Burkholderiales bacterium]|nr:MAG: outer membrane protein assembly factor BamE [Burkholderiales bacterium]CAG0954527.1 Outer membrane protein assembly factor BamE [Burkholderiales bacterium]